MGALFVIDADGAGPPSALRARRPARQAEPEAKADHCRPASEHAVQAPGELPRSVLEEIHKGLGHFSGRFGQLLQDMI